MSQETHETGEKVILVGVDGSAGDAAILRYAAGAARRMSAPVRLAHVVTSYAAIVPVVDIDLEGAAEEVIENALDTARSLMPGVELSATLLHGQRQAALVEAAQDARMVILGKQHRNRFERFITGSTVTALASSAPCPTVVVPDTWTGDTHGAVGVGVKTLDGAPVMVAEAIRIAASRGARLDVVHAWHLPVAAYDALSLPGNIDTESWTDEMQQALSTEVERVLAEHPEVEVTQQVVEAHPANMLAELGERVDLLILARRTRRFPRGHLGGTARTLMREAPCPVAVLPPADGEPCDPEI